MRRHHGKSGKSRKMNLDVKNRSYEQWTPSGRQETFGKNTILKTRIGHNVKQITFKGHFSLA